jgi:hypothetical protein
VVVSAELVELPKARPREAVLRALGNFMERVEQEGAVSIGLAAVTADGGVISIYAVGAGESQWALLGAIENVKLRVWSE